MRQGLPFARFLVPTSWQVFRPARPGVVGAPQRLDSLLELEGSFFSVLPFRLRNQHRIHVAPLPGAGPAPDWQGVRCDFGLAEIWFLHANQQTTLKLPVQVLLPQAAVPVEPLHPFLGQELLRHYSMRVLLDFLAFPVAPAAPLTQPVGRLDWL